MALGILLTAVGIAFTLLYLVNYEKEPTRTTLAATTGTHLLHNITIATTLLPTTTSKTNESATPIEITTTEATTTTEAMTTTSETTTNNTTPPEEIDTTTTTVRGQMALTTPTLPPWMKGETTTGIPDDYKEEP